MRLSNLIKLERQSVETDKGTLIYEGELEVGTAVFVVDENGEEVPAADGDYVFEGMIYTVTGGVITDVREPAERVEVVETEEMAEDTETEPVAEVAEAMVTKAEFDKFVEEVNTWKAEIVAILEELTQSQEDTQMEFSKIKNSPIGKSIKAIEEIGIKKVDYNNKADKFFNGWKQN